MINYHRIAASIDYYAGKGFSRIESPWTVTKETSDITKPKGCSDFSIVEKQKVLVASGEQSFLYLYTKGFLPPGKWQTVTPCFRNDQFDSIHTKYFLKNELIVTDTVTAEELRAVIQAARDFFRQFCLRPKDNNDWVAVNNEPDDVLIIDTSNSRNIVVDNIDVSGVNQYPSYDLSYRGVELGSYGIRKCDFLKWIYGTGCPEPRLTRVMKRFGVIDLS